jgi:prevent-host-death family protein
MQTWPFSAVRAQLSDALRSVEAGDAPMLISRRGQAAGVLMSVAQYRQLSGAGDGFAGRLAAWRNQYLCEVDAPAEGDSPTEVDPFANLRQPDAGRDFAW